MITALYMRFFYGPVLGPLDRFTDALEATATDRVLRDGVAGWRSIVEGLQTFVRLPTRLCAALRQWERSGYARVRAPVDAAAIADAERKTGPAERATYRASRRLRDLGASAGAAEAFTIDGLLEAAFPDEISESESASYESAVNDFAEFCRRNPGAC